jgi:hypothetical protein
MKIPPPGPAAVLPLTVLPASSTEDAPPHRAKGEDAASAARGARVAADRAVGQR